MQDNNKKNFKILISMVLTGAIIFFSFTQYYHNVSKKNLEDTKNILSRRNDTSYKLFESYSLETINKLHIIGDIYFEENFIDDNTKKILYNMFYSRFTTIGERLKVSTLDEFYNKVKGNTNIIKSFFKNNYAIYYNINEKKHILDKLFLFVPIKNNSKATSVLSTYFTLEEIRNFFTINQSDDEYITHIIDANGNILFGKDKFLGISLYDKLRQGKITSGESVKWMKNMVDNRKEFTIKYRKGDKNFYLFFKPSLERFTAFDIIDADRINASISSSYKLGLSIIAQIIIFQLIYMLVLIIMQNKKVSKIEYNKNKEIDTIINNVNGGVLKIVISNDIFKVIFANDKFYSLCGYDKDEFYKSFNNDYISLIDDANKNQIIKYIKNKVTNKKDIKIEHKLKTKNNKACYISFTAKYFGDENNLPIYQCILIDYTNYRHLYDALQIEKERYTILAQISDEIMFEYNIENKSMSITGNFKEKFNIDIDIDENNFFNSLVKSRIIHKDDIKDFILLIRKVKKGEHIFNNEIRLKNKDGQYIWLKYQGSTIRNFEDTVHKVVGRISDITKLKEEIEYLKEKSNRDPLTKVYNKLAIEAIVNTAIKQKPDKNYALFVIDIDNFKMVNDTFGHIFGDEVLKKVSLNILSVFNENEIVARIGGDEFVVFIKNFKNIKYVIEKATVICDLFRRTYKIENKDYKISASVGIALYPTHAKTYKELLKIADIAVYNAKKGGKDRYEIYDDKMSHISLSDIQNMYNAEEEHMIKKQSISSDNILVNIAEMFLQVKNISATIGLVFDIMSKEYNIERAYILYKDDTLQNIHTIYDWKKYDDKTYTNTKHNIDFDDEKYLSIYSGDTFIHYENFQDEYDDDILPYIHKNDNIKSLFTSYFMEGDNVKGYIVIESYEKPIAYSNIENIFIISRFITTQIIKNEDTRRIISAKKITEAVVNSQNLYAYVIDNKFKMLYFDDNIKEIIPDAKIGSTYVLGDKNPSVDIEYIQNNNIALNETLKRNYFCKMQNKSFEISITKINWINTDYAYLVCFRDIS